MYMYIFVTSIYFNIHIISKVYKLITVYISLRFHVYAIDYIVALFCGRIY